MIFSKLSRWPHILWSILSHNVIGKLCANFLILPDFARFNQNRWSWWSHISMNDIDSWCHWKALCQVLRTNYFILYLFCLDKVIKGNSRLSDNMTWNYMRMRTSNNMLRKKKIQVWESDTPLWTLYVIGHPFLFTPCNSVPPVLSGTHFCTPCTIDHSYLYHL